MMMTKSKIQAYFTVIAFYELPQRALVKNTTTTGDTIVAED